jgi:hypothetical protein
MKRTRPVWIALAVSFAGLLANAQEANSGFSIPLELTGNLLYGNLPNSETGTASFSPGFRASLYPTLQLGSHWFAYSALDVQSSSLFGYESGPEYDHPVRFYLLQAFVGYNKSFRNVSIVVKAGRLGSAFGTFPLQYEDAKTLFPSPPPSYIATLPIRPDQVPCGVRDLRSAQYDYDIDFGCGGSEIESYGLLPVSLYGLPGAEIDLSLARVDLRLQVTNSSPANPQGLASSSQFAQWTAGGGYTFRSGLHVGMSGFRGPYLDRLLAPFLPSGPSSPSAKISDFLATGSGVDAQWARGRWSLAGEWQRFTFGLPGFQKSPSEQAAYAELKRIVTPRIYVAARFTALDFPSVEDDSGARIDHAAIPQRVYEFGFGFRPNNHQLLKASYKRLALSTAREERDNVLVVQLVTSVTALSRAFH